MASKWAGFSDAYLKHLKSEPSLSEIQDEMKGVDVAAVGIMNLRGKQFDIGTMSSPVSVYCTNGNHPSVTEDCETSHGLNLRWEENCKAENNSECQNVPGSQINAEDRLKKLETTCNDRKNGLQMENGNFCEDVDSDSSRLQSTVYPLELFEQRQRQMEEDNAKRRVLIAKTILDKKKKTETEARRLGVIQKELNHLDSLLSVDVSVLRDLIEQATVEFTLAQKRYVKAEKEFVAAKTLLFQMMDKKEKLAEHLCRIIEQAEIRKAVRLNELMKQLELTSETFDKPTTSEILSITPTLCALGDVNYSCCTTIKPLHAKKDEITDGTNENAKEGALEKLL